MYDYDIEQQDDITEEEAAPPSHRAARIVLWLIVLSLGLLYLPLLLLTGVIKEDNIRLQGELEAIQVTLDAPEQVVPQVATLQTELQTIREQNVALQNAYNEITHSHVDWPHMMSVFTQYDQTRITLTDISQTGRTINLSGYADTENLAMSYLQQLRDSNAFQSVALQSISQQVAATATPDPTRDGPPPSTVQRTLAYFTIQVVLGEPAS